jgi:hypothetical protein
MRFLFLILAVLGLATFGDLNRSPSGETEATTAAPNLTLTTEAAAGEGIVAASTDGTPIPPRGR